MHLFVRVRRNAWPANDIQYVIKEVRTDLCWYNSGTYILCIRLTRGCWFAEETQGSEGVRERQVLQAAEAVAEDRRAVHRIHRIRIRAIGRRCAGREVPLRPLDDKHKHFDRVVRNASFS